MPFAHAIQSLGLAVQLLIEFRLRQSSTAPVHVLIASMAAPGEIAWVGIKLRCMGHEIPDVSDLVAQGCCARSPQLNLL
jgi:hypothetical protein